jgi:hypothetical protein
VCAAFTPPALSAIIGPTVFAILAMWGIHSQLASLGPHVSSAYAHVYLVTFRVAKVGCTLHTNIFGRFSFELSNFLKIRNSFIKTNFLVNINGYIYCKFKFYITGMKKKMLQILNKQQ